MAFFSCRGERPAGERPAAPPADAVRAPAPAAPAPAAPVGKAKTTDAATHLRIDGTIFVKDGRPFEWRGITAFRLAEQIAHGHEAEAVAFLDWARDRKLTLVRALVMAKHLFELDHAAGIAALPRLLQLAAERGLYVEVVIFADTAGVPLDRPAVVKAAGVVAAGHANAVIEIANEPWHPTQDPALHDPSIVRQLADLVPREVPVALGAIEGGDEYAAGRYATWHAPRADEPAGWGHVLALAEGAALVSKWQKPVISDEPIGAAEKHVAGRRDNEPRRFAAAAVLTRLAGLGATFHYEGGLQARIPAGPELECFTAWSRALDALAGLPVGGRFLKQDELAPLGSVTGARAVFGRLYDTEVWVAAIDPVDLRVQWQTPWRERSRAGLPGVTLFRLSRDPHAR